jgi:hypothetical protein
MAQTLVENGILWVQTFDIHLFIDVITWHNVVSKTLSIENFLLKVFIIHQLSMA